MENTISDQEKIKYLKEWHWESEPHQAGFDVWSHNRFPNKKYKLNRAYEVMKANEPSLEPILTVKLDDEEGMQKLKNFTAYMKNPEAYEKAVAIDKISDMLGIKDKESFAKQFYENNL